MEQVLNDTRVVDMLDTLSKQLDGEDRELLSEFTKLAGEDPELLLKLLKDLASFEYKWQPVDMETFLLSKDYLNLKGQIFPRLLADLVELFEDPIQYSEAVACGGIGWGKSTLAECALARMVYETSCLKNPQQAFGLMDGSTIAFINASVNLKQAEKVIFHGLKQKLGGSPYFKEQFPFDADLKKEMRFPGNLLVMPVAGSEGGTVGYNVLGGVLDEVNFWQVVEASSLNRGQKFDQARHVYDLLIRRIKSRFGKAGKMPGLLLQVSSSKYPDDFTEARILEVTDAVRRHVADPIHNAHPKTLTRRYSTWDTKPRTDYLPESFWLYRGATNDQPEITKDLSTFADKDPALIVEVPMDFWNDFYTDLNGAIRDLAGYPTLSIQPFFPQKDKIVEAMERGRQRNLKHPYTVLETTLEDGAYFNPKLCQFDRSKSYFAHVDLAIKKDRCGVAVAHIDSWKTVTRISKATGQLLTQREPVVVVDFMLRIEAAHNQEIPVSAVRGLLLELRNFGCNLRKVTYDQYQSAESIQAFQRLGIDSEKMSVDQPIDAYMALKEAFLEDRIILYPYQPLLEELVRLEVKENGTRTKVDHPPKAFKDVSDAVCGAVYHCILAKSYAIVDPSYGVTEDTAYDADDPSWKNPMRGALPIKEGQKKRTEDAWLWRGVPGHEVEDDEDDDSTVGFA